MASAEIATTQTVVQLAAVTVRPLLYTVERHGDEHQAGERRRTAADHHEEVVPLAKVEHHRSHPMLQDVIAADGREQVQPQPPLLTRPIACPNCPARGT